MVAKKTAIKSAAIEVVKFEKARVSFRLIGESPLIYNAMSQKSKMELICPGVKKSAATKASTAKHNPVREFRDGVYMMPDDDERTLLGLPGHMFKAAMVKAAISLDGIDGTTVKRLIWVEGEMNPVWGVPKMSMMVVKPSGINAAPDIRTRAILKRWATIITIRYHLPMLTQNTVMTLIAAAGSMAGIGDYRIERGGSYGAFLPEDGDNGKQIDELMKYQGKEAQTDAMQNYEFHDIETAKLFDYWKTDTMSRGMIKESDII